MTDTELRTLGVIIAALGGAAIGVERERSGHAKGPAARFAGVRTFTLLGGLAGLSGWLWAQGMPWLAAVLLAGAVALVVVAYLAVAARDPDGTTEVAALVTLAAGVLAGLGHLAFSSAVVAVAALLLIEKSRVHAWVDRLDDTAVRAGIRFAVMAVVLMPLLPPGPYGPLGGVRPRELWVFVLFFSGISFAGYIARLFVGARHGYLVAGLLGGIVSSTSVTLSFSRASKKEDASVGRPLAYGVLAACTTLFVRVAVATAVLSLPLASSSSRSSRRPSLRAWPPGHRFAPAAARTAGSADHAESAAVRGGAADGRALPGGALSGGGGAGDVGRRGPCRQRRDSRPR